MKKSIFSSLLALALSLGGQAGYAIPTELVTNGDFEMKTDYGLTGWMASPNVKVRGTHKSVSPYGEKMAVMSPGGKGNSSLFQSVAIDTSAYHTLDLSFAYNMRADDRSEYLDYGDDTLNVRIGGYDLLSISLNDMFDSPCASTAAVEPGQPAPDVFCTSGSTIAGWSTFAKTYNNIPDFGIVSLDFQFDVHNRKKFDGDNGQRFTAYIDNVSIKGYGNGVASAVPVPGTLALFGVGLLGLAGVRRRQETLVS